MIIKAGHFTSFTYIYRQKQLHRTDIMESHITDITILIAVIALSLWPIVLFILRFLHERNKRLERLDRLTKNELDDISTQELVTQTLQKIGCQPETDEEGHINFKYQGEDFYIAAEEGSRFIMIWNPWWGSISSDNEALPYLKEVINLTNVSSLVTAVFVTDEDDEKTIGLHAHCHTFFSPGEGQLDEHLKLLLDSFFDTQTAIKESMNQIGSAVAAQQEKERGKIKGFAAYKENTSPIEAGGKKTD